jgi:hypothetical protein
VDGRGNCSSQIQLSVDLDGGFGGAKPYPGKHIQAQVDRCRIQRIDGLLQLHPKRIACVKPSGFADEMLGQLGIHLPGPMFVGVGQRTAADRAANPQVIELRSSATQADLDVAQTLSVGQLSEGQAQKLI